MMLLSKRHTNCKPYMNTSTGNWRVSWKRCTVARHSTRSWPTWSNGTTLLGSSLSSQPQGLQSLSFREYQRWLFLPRARVNPASDIFSLIAIFMADFRWYADLRVSYPWKDEHISVSQYMWQDSHVRSTWRRSSQPSREWARVTSSDSSALGVHPLISTALNSPRRVGVISLVSLIPLALCKEEGTMK